MWALAVGGGFVVLTQYQSAPGKPAQAPETWPSETRLPPAPNEATLLVFAHPHCPCTDATMEELARLISHVRDSVRVHAVFLQPTQFSDAWTTTSLWQRAGAISDVRTWRDRGGQETTRFGVRTSGQVLLYGTDGMLRFQGGITGSRGHEGDNAGRAALNAILSGKEPETTQTFVFGCAMQDDGALDCPGNVCLR